MPKKGETWTPEHRAKIEAAFAAKRAVKAPEQAPIAPETPRERMQYAARPEKPSGSRWVMKAGRWDHSAMENAAVDDGDKLGIPKDQWPEGITMMWVTQEVRGDRGLDRTPMFETSGWLPVHGEDFDGQFDGMFTPKGTRGPIVKEGLMLMAKPTEMVDKSYKRDQQDAKNVVQIKERDIFGGKMDGVMGADHETAKRFNHVKRSVERVTIPEE